MDVHENWCVYCHTNKINGKKYIGQTANGDNPNRRWNNGNGYKSNNYFWSAIQKYGWENFEHEIIKIGLSQDEANYWEKYYIKEYNTMDSDYGYNLNSGGNNAVPNKETRKMMSNSKKENWKDVEYRQRMVESRYNFLSTHPDYTSELSKTIKKLYEDPEYKEKIKIARKNKGVLFGRDSPVSRPVYCFELDETFWGAKEASDKYGILRSSICACCRKTGRHLSAGTHPETGELLHWCYLDEKDTYIISNHKEHPTSKKIFCPELNESFWGVTEAKDKYKINNISACLNGKLKSAGKHPDTGEPLHWEYVDNNNGVVYECSRTENIYI